MSHHGLLEYIRQAKGLGASDSMIADRLHSAGWYRVDIQDALELYRRVDRPVQLASAPAYTLQESPQRIPRMYDPMIAKIAVISFILGFVAYVLLVR